MDSISDRLQALGVRLGSMADEPLREKKNFPIEAVLPGSIIPTRYGETFFVETLYPIGHLHGQVHLQPTLAPEPIIRWMGESDQVSRSAEALVFLDTETTGLAGGAGTMAFLVGVGRFINDHFRIVQFFLRDPIEEPALLAALEEFLIPCEVLVSFNGKSFDLPLLNSRYISNGWGTRVQLGAHLDLLHLARRLWRHRLPSRTLNQLEIHILRTQRSEEDVPGWMIPDIYFDYLRRGDARPLKSVFYHNAMDVLSMAALLRHIKTVFSSSPEDEGFLGVDFVALGEFFEDLGETERAQRLFLRAMAGDLPVELYHRALKRSSLIAKRQGDYSAAMELWRKAAQHGQVFAFVELAKYFEHQSRDLEEAYKWTEAAVKYVSSSEVPKAMTNRWLGDLEHRRKRLMRKLGWDG